MSIRDRRRVLAALAAGMLIALSGCGSSSTGTPHAEHTSTATVPTPPHRAGSSRSGGHTASIGVLSAARMGNLVINPRYTCYGQDISPPLDWAGVPSKTKETVIFVRTIWHGGVTTNWAVAGISPSLSAIAAGKVPAGGIVGRNSSGKVGYSLCPPAGAPALITMGVYAFPRTLPLKEGFDPNTLTHELASGEVQWGGVSMLANERRTG
jgi:phosphatidylethanolamine-binding protein (PEBP) family uncharacterized protein